jgi:hypothetical protein
MFVAGVPDKARAYPVRRKEFKGISVNGISIDLIFQYIYIARGLDLEFKCLLW